MAGKSKIVKKAEKASVRAAATPVGSAKPGQMLSEAVKRNRLAKAAKGKAKEAGPVPGSPYLRKTGNKTSKSLAKRVNQSRVARGGSPRPLYTSKAKAAEISARMAKAGKKTLGSQTSGNRAVSKADLSKKKLDGRGGYN
jgi:hypothetical protein